MNVLVLARVPDVGSCGSGCGGVEVLFGRRERGVLVVDELGAALVILHQVAQLVEARAHVLEFLELLASLQQRENVARVLRSVRSRLRRCESVHDVRL